MMMGGGCTKGKDCGKDGQDKPYAGQRDLSFFGTSSLVSASLYQNVDGIYLDDRDILNSEDFPQDYATSIESVSFKS